MNKQYQIWTDGGARGNPGSAAIGFVIKCDGKIVKTGSKYIGHKTNNQAEYEALIEALTELIEYTDITNTTQSTDIMIYTDSQLMAFQVTGRYKVKNANLQDLLTTTHSKLSKFQNFKITPIPRDENQEADRLVNLALDTQILSNKS